MAAACRPLVHPDEVIERPRAASPVQVRRDRGATRRRPRRSQDLRRGRLGPACAGRPGSSLRAAPRLAPPRLIGRGGPWAGRAEAADTADRRATLLEREEAAVGPAEGPGILCAPGALRAGRGRGIE